MLLLSRILIVCLLSCSLPLWSVHGQDSVGPAAVPEVSIEATPAQVKPSSQPQVVVRETSPVSAVSAGPDQVTSVVAPIISSTVAPSLPTIPSATNGAVATLSMLDKSHLFVEYMRPVCDALDKLSAKQINRVQSQFKQFAQMTSNKLSKCFLEHYSIDLGDAKIVTRENLLTICQSRPLAFGKGSFKAFSSCANESWNEAIDRELARILSIRHANLKKHQHQHAAQHANVIGHVPPMEHHHHLLHEDEDEIKVVNNVLGSVLNNVMSHPSEIKVIDARTTISPTVEDHLNQLTSSKVIVVNTTQAPLPSANQVKIVVAGQSNPIATTSSAPSIAAKSPLSNATFTSSSKTVHIAVNSTTAVPSIKKTNTTTRKPTTKSPTSLLLSSTTKTPLETLEQVLERQEKILHDLEIKFKQEREQVIKEMHKRQDEIDAQNAIKALQAQRMASVMKVPPSKLHQLEHERQMAIDPVKHAMKHQRYERVRARTARPMRGVNWT